MKADYPEPLSPIRRRGRGMLGSLLLTIVSTVPNISHCQGAAAPHAPLFKKGSVLLKSRCYTALTTLGLALSFLGSAGAARAASVTGSAMLPYPGSPMYLQVDAASGPAGTKLGTVLLTAGTLRITADVVALDVTPMTGGGYMGVVSSVVTSNNSFSGPRVGAPLTATILDYGSTNDMVNVYYEVFSPYHRFVTIYRGGISGGNFIVTP
jgi:hypothetical protein